MSATLGAYGDTAVGFAAKVGQSLSVRIGEKLGTIDQELGGRGSVSLGGTTIIH